MRRKAPVCPRRLRIRINCFAHISASTHTSNTCSMSMHAPTHGACMCVPHVPVTRVAHEIHGKI